ncbi:unnamed protein product, partial [Brenthis ino]
METIDNDDRGQVPLSEVGFAGQRSEENMQSNKASTSSQEPNFLLNMEMELHSHNVVTRYQLFRILNGISLKRRHDGNDSQEIEVKRTRFNEGRFTGACHRCGVPGHRAIDCRKKREDPSSVEKTPSQSSRIPDKTRVITCYVCGQSGHRASTCPERKGGSSAPIVKEVNICKRKSSMSTLTTSSGEPVSFLFDSGSACSLVTCSFSKKFSGTIENNLVYLTGIGRENVKCNSQVLSSINVQGYSGLVEAATILINNAEEAETAIHGQENEGVPSDDDSDTMSIASSQTLTASSGTLSASERDEN